MEKSILVVVINIIINFFEGVMFYYLCCNLIDKHLELSVKTVLFGISYGIALGVLFSYLNVYLFKIIATIFMMLIIKWVTGKRIQDVLLIYGITFITIVIMQIILTIFVVNLSLKDVYVSLLVQTFTLIGIMILSSNVSLNKLFNKIEKEILLKLFIFSLTSIYLIIYAYFNFDYSFVREYILYFSVLVIISFIGLYRTLKRVFFYTNTVPMQLHDVKNMLMGVHITSYLTSDINMVRNSLDQCLNILNIDANVENINANEYSESILSFINKKKGNGIKEVNFIIDIEYFENHAKVSFSVIIYMLGVLLDNAIESGTKKDVFIKLHVSEAWLQISIANEYERKSKDDFEKMFQKRYSTKGTNSRGYGLPNLSKAVTDYGGDIQLRYDYNIEQKSYYLKICIDIKI